MCSLLGLPFANGLIPQAPLHVYSLATIKETYEERKKGDVLITKRKEVWTNVYENRSEPSFFLPLSPPFLPPLRNTDRPRNQSVAPHAKCADRHSPGALPTRNRRANPQVHAHRLAAHIYLRLTHLASFVYMVRGVLMGLFLYMGFASFRNNQFFDRILLLVADPVKREKVVKEPYLYSVPLKVVVAFTLLQLLFLGGVVGITVSDTPAAIAFPVFITLAVPIRKWLLPRIPGFTHVHPSCPVSLFVCAGVGVCAADLGGLVRNRNAWTRWTPTLLTRRTRRCWTYVDCLRALSRTRKLCSLWRWAQEPDDLVDADGQDDLELATLEDRTNGDGARSPDAGGEDSSAAGSEDENDAKDS